MSLPLRIVLLVGCGLEPAGTGAGWRLAGARAAGVLDLVAAIAAAGDARTSSAASAPRRWMTSPPRCMP